MDYRWVGEETEIYIRLQKANVIIFVDLPVEEHLHLAKQRERAPTKTSPCGCSYKDMFDRVAAIIRCLDSILIPKLRKDIPKIAQQTNVTVYHVSKIDELKIFFLKQRQ